MPTEAVVIAFFATGLQLMVPILLAALGETISERSGVLNVGIEGSMLIGALITALVGINTESVTLALVLGWVTGMGAGVVLAFLYVYRGTDQIVTGLLFNIFALGLTGLLDDRFVGGQIGPTLSPLDVPLLGDIPKVGDVLNGQDAMFWITLAIVVLAFYLIYRTWWGLYARAAGERPHATESGGLDVQRLRYPAVILGNGLAALGGGALVMSSAGGFVPGMTEGRGFIALGVVVVARWNPFWALAVSALFGLSQALQFVAGRVDLTEGVPSQVWLALPYVATVLAVLLSRGSRYPAAVGIPWRREAAGRA
ncbi:MAG: ABC transporter permease [bacterium]|nr:ABC transporter permease [bacterium]